MVRVQDDRPIYLRDVARVVDGPDQPSRYVWIGFGAAGERHRQRPGTARGDDRGVEEARRERGGRGASGSFAAAELMKGTVVPEGVEVRVTRNYGATAADKANKLIQKLMFATLSVVALVFATLGRREAVIVGAAVLLTLAATLFASWAWGFTLNRVSLFALIFSIGILVDDAIVVVENIHRRHSMSNAPLSQIIPAAVDEVGGPTILATLPSSPRCCRWHSSAG